MTRNLTQHKNKIVMLGINSIRPAPENVQVYKPTDRNDPDLLALAESIGKHGVQEPLVVTSDGYILSGHRRHAAARMAGLERVPCRVLRISREKHPEKVLRLLIEFNTQRVKTQQEMLREEVVRMNPEEEHRALVEYRETKSDLRVRRIKLGDIRGRSALSDAKKPFLEAVQRIVEENKKWWPLSDRQIHYPLLNNPPLMHAGKPDSIYRNDRKCYKNLCDLLTRARLLARPAYLAAEPGRNRGGKEHRPERSA